jgi:glycosyltransferase involved in cell wall biosynthesis
LAAGRLTAQKDHYTLIKAFSLLRARRRVRLVILGEGELLDSLQSLAVKLGVADDIAWPGFVENPYTWMKHCSLFVLSSAYEGLPGVLIQAMACGVPVVSTDCPSGPAEILENGRWGRLVPVGDAKALANAMEDTLGEPQHPDVAVRAKAFGVNQALNGYLKAFGVVVDDRT